MAGAATFLVLAAGFLVATISAAWITKQVAEISREKGWTDDPGVERKIHESAVPDTGGIAIAGGIAVGLAYFALVDTMGDYSAPFSHLFSSSAFLVCAITMFVVGLYDDLKNLSFEHKFVLQVVVASIVIHEGLIIERVSIPLSTGVIDLGWLGVPITLAWIVGLINAINLLDGMDGLAAGIALIVFTSLATAYSVIDMTSSVAFVLVVAGALTGFLYHNFHPATIFMGDCGSLLIGFLIATYSLQGPVESQSLMAFLIPALALGVPILDTGLAVVRRFLEARSLFHPDDDHIHHRVTRLFGLGQRGTVLFLYGLSVVFGALAVLASMANRWEVVGVTLGAGMILYGVLRLLRYFRLRDLPWLIRERHEFKRLRDRIEREAFSKERIRGRSGGNGRPISENAAEPPVGENAAERPVRKDAAEPPVNVDPEIPES